MDFKRFGKMAVIGFASLSILAACGGNESNTTDANAKGEPKEESKEVTKVKVAFSQDGKPISYIDDNGEPAGYEVDAMKLVDEKLEDYEFTYIPTSSDDIFVGVQHGKYDIGVKNAFFTEERTKTYLYPEQFLGLSSTGFVVKAENANIKNLSDLATSGKTLAPIAASSAQYTLVQEYNEANPENQVELKAGEEFSLDVVQWVNEGRSDAAIVIEAIYNGQVLAEDGPYHNLKDDVVYNEFAVIKTWPLFNKEQTELAKAYDEAMAEIHASGELGEIMQKHYGKDLFPLLD